MTWNVEYNLGLSKDEIVAVVEHKGELIIATKDTLYKLVGDEVRPIRLIKGRSITMDGEEEE